MSKGKIPHPFTSSQDNALRILQCRRTSNVSGGLPNQKSVGHGHTALPNNDKTIGALPQTLYGGHSYFCSAGIRLRDGDKTIPQSWVLWVI